MIVFGQNNSEGNSGLNQIVAVLRGALGWFGEARDVAGRVRTTIENGTITTVTTVTTVGTVTGVTTLANQANTGGYAANDQIFALMAMQAQGLRARISVS